MWIHWISTYYVDPDNWIGQMYDSQLSRHLEGVVLVQQPAGRRPAAQGAVYQRAGRPRPLYEEAARLVVADSPDIWIYNIIQVSRRFQSG